MRRRRLNRSVYFLAAFFPLAGFFLVSAGAIPRRLSRMACFSRLRFSSVRMALRFWTAAYGLRRCMTRAFLRGFFLRTRLTWPDFLGARRTLWISSLLRSLDRSVLVILVMGRL